MTPLPTTAISDTHRKFPLVVMIYDKSPNDRNDHSRDWDEVGKRTEFVSLVASQVIWGMAVLFIIGLYLAHLYYKKEKREQYTKEREVMIRELQQRRASLLFGPLNLSPVEQTQIDALRPTEAMPALVSRWNSIMHVFYNFRV
uniref:Uncharacterized protein n=1 Tax=Plectus sambesii TaxID=2011161 RepID=A0A914VH04_9BILA